MDCHPVLAHPCSPLPFLAQCGGVFFCSRERSQISRAVAWHSLHCHRISLAQCTPSSDTAAQHREGKHLAGGRAGGYCPSPFHCSLGQSARYSTKLCRCTHGCSGCTILLFFFFSGNHWQCWYFTEKVKKKGSMAAKLGRRM